MAKAIWENAVIADSDQTIEIEGNQYFPADSVKREILTHEELFLKLAGERAVVPDGAAVRSPKTAPVAVKRFLEQNARIEGADAKSLRDAVDQLKGKLGSSVIVLATVQEGKVVLVAGVSADLLGRMKAGEIAGSVAAQVGGKGGGRADFAQAGGTQPENLGQALEGVEALIRSRLAN